MKKYHQNMTEYAKTLFMGICPMLETFKFINRKVNIKQLGYLEKRLNIEPFFDLTKLFQVNFPVKVNRESELTEIYSKVSSTGICPGQIQKFTGVHGLAEVSKEQGEMQPPPQKKRTLVLG